MALIFNPHQGGCCPDPKGCCDDGPCPDFVIRRYDTKPPFKVEVSDCDGPFNVQGLVVEVNMWADARLRHSINQTATYFRLADNIGFDQVMLGDIILMDRVRAPEYMLMTGFDEENCFIQVQRGYRNSMVSNWKKGTKMKIFRVMDSPAEIELVFEDLEQVDGTKEKNTLAESYLVYEWQPEDVCLPGCYHLEFKVMKMIATVYYLPGGQWNGATHTWTDGFFYTGSEHTDSSVKLSFDQTGTRPLNRTHHEEHHHGISVTINTIGTDMDPNDIIYDINGNIISSDPQGEWGRGNRAGDGFSTFDNDDHDYTPSPPANVYWLPDTVWNGATHIESTGAVLTGSQHDDGSVYLSETGIPSNDNAVYNDQVLTAQCYDISSTSITPSFTEGLSYTSFTPSFTQDLSITPSFVSTFFNCALPTGVEWVRRFPVQGNFLIRVEDTQTPG